MSSPFPTNSTQTATPLTDNKGGLMDRFLALFNRGKGPGQANFGPGQPITPTMEQDASEQEQPRVREYPVASNIFLRPRSEEGTLTPFEQLRSLAANYDVAQLCHQTLCNELAALEWDVMPVAAADKASARAAKERLNAPAEKVRDFLKYPDRQRDFATWATELLIEDLEIGAPFIYRQRARNGELLGLDVIQGDLMKPLIDYRGKTVGYRQIYRGMALGDYTLDDVLCCPRITRRGSAYGVSPLEKVIINVNLALRRQMFDLAYFTDGNIPEALAGTPEDWTTEDIKLFQEWFDTLMVGNLAQQRKIKMWPGDPSKIFQLKQREPNTDQQLWTLLVTCAIHGVNPEEIGFGYLSKGKSTSEGQADSQQRTGVKPIALWLERVLTRIIQQDMAQPELRFGFKLNEKQENQLQEAQAHSIYIKAGVYGAEYVRDQKDVPPNYAPKQPVVDETQPPTPDPFGDGGADGGDSHTPISSNDEADNMPASGQPPNENNKAALSDLRKWRDKAARLAKEGKPFAHDFVPSALTIDDAQLIHERLANAKSIGDVRDVFNQVITERETA